MISISGVAGDMGELVAERLSNEGGGEVRVRLPKVMGWLGGW